MTTKYEATKIGFGLCIVIIPVYATLQLPGFPCVVYRSEN